MADTMSTSKVLPAAEPGGAKGRFNWRRLQVVAAVVAIGTFLVPMILAGEVEGFLAAMAAPFAIGLLLVKFLPRTGAIFLGVVSLAILLFSAPFIVDSLRHPESAADFIPMALLTLATVLCVVAVVPAYREVRGAGETSPVPRLLAGGCTAAALVLAVISVVAATQVDNVAAQPGDVTITTRDFMFSPVRVSAQAGTVSLHVTNEDATRHTFTIDGVTDLSIPPGGAQRVTFDAAAGEYRFYCRPHAPDMDGALALK